MPHSDGMFGILEPLPRELELQDLLRYVTYKRGWTFLVSTGCLMIEIQAIDSQRGHPTKIMHRRPIPGGRVDLKRWLLECILQVEQHEAMEFFAINGKAPFFPDHTPGGNPYAVVERENPVPVAQPAPAEPEQSLGSPYWLPPPAPRPRYW